MLISVVVPVFKVEKYIHRCVDSILSQTFADFELILVDDGSPDNCGTICDEYAKNDERIYVIHKENGGLSDARNVGIDWAFSNSDSEWITFIDSDDWLHPKYLEALYNAVIDTGCEISICSFEETEDDIPSVDETRLIAEVVNTESFFCEHNVNAVVAWGKLYKKELFRDIRYPVGKLHEDEFTTYKLLFKNRKCAFVIQPLYYYFINNSSITKSDWSPKRIVVINAILENIVYYKENGYKQVYEYYLKRLVRNSAAHYTKLLDSHEKTTIEKYKRFLIFSLKKGLRLCRKEKILSFSDNKYYYELAYPHIMNVYWLMHVLISKIRRE